MPASLPQTARHSDDDQSILDESIVNTRFCPALIRDWGRVLIEYRHYLLTLLRSQSSRHHDIMERGWHYYFSSPSEIGSRCLALFASAASSWGPHKKTCCNKNHLPKTTKMSTHTHAHTHTHTHTHGGHQHHWASRMQRWFRCCLTSANG